MTLNSAAVAYGVYEIITLCSQKYIFMFYFSSTFFCLYVFKIFWWYGVENSYATPATPTTLRQLRDLAEVPAV